MSDAPRILVVDDEPGLRQLLSVLLKRRGYAVSVASGVGKAREALEGALPFEGVITDLKMPDGTGIDVLRAAKARAIETQVIVITAHTSTEDAVAAMRQGAYDFIEKPFSNDVLVATLDKALDRVRIERENTHLRAELSGAASGIIGTSQAIRQLRDLITRAAGSRASVLITGESGTGKELVARALHRESDRQREPFVAINCGALPEPLMESELFGHKKGAFTGADKDKIGLFMSASGGTLFLDEVGELPLPLQIKLLRVLQERRVRPVGANEDLPIDVRVVAATNRDIEEEVRVGNFREDLYYRLNVIRLVVPPLRERRSDVRLIATHLLQKHAALSGQAGKPMRFSDDAMNALLRAELPGNVRELENLIERGVALARHEVVEAEDLMHSPPAAAPEHAIPTLDEHFDLDAYLAEIERAILLEALRQSEGVKTKAAELLKMSFRSFRYRLAKLDLESDPESQADP